MLTQSAPAADPAPCVQMIEKPILDCEPMFDPTTGHYHEICVTNIGQEWVPCDF